MAQEFNGAVVPFEQFHTHLYFADIVIGSAGGNDYLVGRATVEEALRERKRRPMFFIDLGVPRNFDPRLNDIENIFLYDIDDLQQVIEENKDEREREALKAEAIVTEKVENVWQWPPVSRRHQRLSPYGKKRRRFVSTNWKRPSPY